MINIKALLQNIGANSLTMGIMTVFQLLSVPIFIKYWGVELYGEWIVLNTLTAYFQMTDIGLNTATGNEFSFYYAKKKYDKCNVLINNNIFFLILAFLFMFLVLIALNQMNLFAGLFQFKIITLAIVKASLIILFAQVFVGTLNNLLNTIYRATNYFARGIMIDNVIRISEYLVILLGVILSAPIPKILFAGLAVKILGLVFKYFDSSKLYNLLISIKYYSYSELKRTIIPAVSFFSFPIANSIAFQGFTLLINFLMGSVAVVVFNTTRTLINLIKSGIDILHKSIWPELSLAYGRNDTGSFKKMHRYAVVSSFAIAFLSALFLVFFGKNIYVVWTEYKVEFDSILFYLFIVTLLSNTIWSSSSIVLQSTNNHIIFSLIYLVATIASLGLAYLILIFTKTISYMPFSLLLIELSMSTYVIRKSLQLTGDTLRDFMSAIVQDVENLKFLL